MAVFQYEAASESGATITGKVEATDRRSAVSVLAERGEYVTQLKAATGEKELQDADHEVKVKSDSIKLPTLRGGKISGKDVLTFTSQLSISLRSGLPLLDCLGVIRQQSAKSSMRSLLGELSKYVSTGDSLSDAMSKRPDVFKPLHCALIRVEEMGDLDETSTQLVGLLSREEKIKSHMKNASAYPLFVLGIGMISVIAIVTWLLPTITGTIMSEGLHMPWPTRMLLGLSAFFRSYYSLGLLALVILLLYLFRRWKRSETGRLAWDGFLLKFPVLGSVLLSISVGRFARTFGSLTKGGIVVLEALGVVRDTLGNEVLSRDIDTVIEQVRTGEPIAKPLAESGRFPPLLVQIVSVGEQTGKLDDLLLNAAETFDSEADVAIARFMAIMPAVLVLLLAVIIGFIIMATLLPIFSMQVGVAGF